MFTTTLRTATSSAVRASRVGVPRGMATVSDRVRFSPARGTDDPCFDMSAGWYADETRRVH